MVYFRQIMPTKHYLENHAKDVPWEKVIEIILSSKRPRKKGTKFQIQMQGYYLLFEIRDSMIFVINAKKVRP